MLTRQAEDLFTVDHELRIPPGVPFPTRMTVVRARDHSLALISPIPLDDVLATELARLGPVAYLFAPNLLHHLHLAAAKRRYPDARVLGPADLVKKQPSLTFEPIDFLDASPLRETLSAELVDGAPKLSETVFFHHPSRTLIVTDLVFNIVTPPAWTTSMLLRMTGTRGRLAQSRIWRFAIEDASRARASCQRILDWDFERLIVAHGDIIHSGAKARVAGALKYTDRTAWRQALTPG